jgi:hypothetical protein
VKPLVLAAVLVMAGAARADFVRGTLKIDVRDAAGTPREAKVVVRPEAGGESRKVSRTGEVYVAEGLIDGVWLVEVEGAAPQTVKIAGHGTLGVVAVLGQEKAKKKKQKPTVTVGADEPPCDDDAGTVIEAVAFAGGRLGAGRLEVRKKGKLVCVAAIAGGAVTLRLRPGEYAFDARFVGGGSTHSSYGFRADHAPPPLVFRVR